MVRDLIVNSTSAAKGVMVNKVTNQKLSVNKVHIMNNPYHNHFNLKKNEIIEK